MQAFKFIVASAVFAGVYAQDQPTDEMIDEAADVIAVMEAIDEAMDDANGEEECTSDFWFDCNSIVWPVETTEDASTMTLIALSMMGLGTGSSVTGASLSSFVSNANWANYIATALNGIDFLTYIWAFAMWSIQNEDPNEYSTFRNWRVGLVHALIASVCTLGATAIQIALNASTASAIVNVLLSSIGGSVTLFGAYLSFFNRDLWLAADPHMNRVDEDFDFLIWQDDTDGDGLHEVTIIDKVTGKIIKGGTSTVISTVTNA